MNVLNRPALLQTRIVLLNPIAVYFIVQKEGEVREQIKQRAGQEAVGFEQAAILPLLSVIGPKDSRAHATACRWIDKTKAI